MFVRGKRETAAEKFAGARRKLGKDRDTVSEHSLRAVSTRVTEFSTGGWFCRCPLLKWKLSRVFVRRRSETMRLQCYPIHRHSPSIRFLLFLFLTHFLILCLLRGTRSLGLRVSCSASSRVTCYWFYSMRNAGSYLILLIWSKSGKQVFFIN